MIPLLLASAFLAALLALAAVLLWMSPGKPAPFLDDAGHPLPGSISEKIHVTINGADQGMFIKGRDARNPVLLYLHGGMPDYFLTRRYPPGPEQYFTVVWWEQRGSGLSYRPGIPGETLNVEQMISDALSLTDYLRRRFGQDKIYLMGHSGGTFFGIQAAARAPEKYHCYIGMEQMSHQLRSEQLAYQYMLARFRETGDTRMARKLERSPVGDTVPLPAAYQSLLRDVAMHRLGIGTTHDMRSIVRELMIESFRHREYTLAEKINLWRGKLFSRSRLWDAQLSTDLTRQVTRLEIPVYFFHGRYDYTVSYPLARAYFDRLEAPLKGFYTFQQSAHSPLFEEPGRMREIMLKDVLAGTNRLADHDR